MNPATSRRWLAINWAAAIFVSAFLLFQVQPLVSKSILPWFGGTPAVWTTCMLFFQSLLFAGYAYAHFSQQWLTPRRQAFVHLVLIAAAICLLRVVPDDSWQPQDSSNPIGRILLMLAATVGLPYFVLSSTGPLLQAWFVRVFPGKAPYRLYALSNVGSLLALVSYPIAFERMFDIRQQAGYWSWGFMVYGLLCGVAAASLWALFRHANDSGPSAEGAHEAAAAGVIVADEEGPPDAVAIAVSHESNEPPRWWQSVLWLALPAFASVALLATTNHVCTDVAVMPFLWVVPLALYLVTFIIAFDHPRWYRPAWTAMLTLLAIYAVALVYYSGLGAIDVYQCGTPGKWYRYLVEHTSIFRGFEPTMPASPQFHVDFQANLVLNFIAMFGVCMLCHGELVRQRPHPRYLTAFYLMIAAGGALGGVSVSLVAPHVFKTFFEWELSLYLGTLLALVLLVRTWVTIVNRREATTPKRRRLRLTAALGVPAVLAALSFTDLSSFLAYANTGVQMRARNFFGTLTVRERDADQPEIRDFVLQHGAITHGVQFAAPDRRGQPTTYYSTISGVGHTLNYFREHPLPSGLNIGAVGLGVGTLASYVAKGDSISFYEINQEIIDIAESDRWFSYLKDCNQRGGDYRIVLGDARLTLERELHGDRRRRYDVLVLDAFSGDAIPAHLLTEEAFKIYLEHLATPEAGGRHGAIAVHITNRYADLDPVVRGIAERFGLEAVRIKNGRVGERAIYSADWMILSRDQDLLNALAQHAVPPEEHQRPAILWTDARSNLFDVLK